MAKSNDNSSKSTSEALLNEAQKLFGAELKTPISSIDTDMLEEMVGAEKGAKEVASNMSTQIPGLMQGAMEAFSKGLMGTKLNEQQKKDANYLFSSMVLKHMQEASGPFLESSKEDKGVLFNAMLSQNTVDVLQGILDFKKKIDEQFPGLSDTILSAAKLGITFAMLSTVQSSILLIALDQTKILDKSLDFFKTDNLEKTIGKLKESLGEINKDKELADSMKNAEKMSEISKESGLKIQDFAKLGIPSRFLDSVLEDVSAIPEVKDFMQCAADFGQKVIPNNNKDLEVTLKGITDHITKQLKQSGVGGENLNNVIKEVSAEIKKVEGKWQEALGPDKQFFDKVIAQQECATELMDICSRIAGKLEGVVNDPKAVANIVSNSVSKVVKDKVQGSAEELKQHMENPKVAQFAKNNMGSKLRSNEAIKRAEKALGIPSESNKLDSNTRAR